MKKVIFFAVILSLFVFINATLDSETQEIKQKVEKMLLKCALKEKEDPTCEEQVVQFRAVWRFLPNELKELIIEEVSNQIWSQFPGIPRAIVDRMIRNFGNLNVKPEGKHLF
jgi:hypothetical protein